MSRFLIDCDRKSFVFEYAVRNQPIWTLELNDEWTLVYASVNDQHTTTTDYFIGLRRKNTVGELTVDGELTITNTGCRILDRKFSLIMEAGSSFVKISRVRSINMVSGVHKFRGYLNIVDKNKKSLEGLSNDLERLLDPEASCFADVVLKCDGSSIPAHKNILSARSPVFKAMFANPMKESQKNEVEVTDMNIDALRALLVYMYTGKTCNLTATSATHLLIAADKYQVQDLKNVCIDALKASVSDENVVKLLILGDLLSEDLRRFAKDYFCDKYTYVFDFKETKEWERLQKQRPGLAKEVLTCYYNSRDQWRIRQIIAQGARRRQDKRGPDWERHK